MKKSTLLFCFAFVFGGVLFAQQAVATLDIGNFEAPIRADGQLFQDQTYQLGGLEWPKTAVAVDKRYISYTGQIWMAGHDQQGTLRVAANEYGQGGEGYFPGRAGFANASWNNVWKISKAEIDQFRADFANGTVNFTNYPVIQSWPAFGTTTLGVVKAYAPYVNVDNNPADYNPSAGDYPDVPGDQAIFFGFTDNPASQAPRFANNLGFDVLAMAYSYTCSDLEDVLFLRYDIINGTTNSYTDFTVGMWQDNDIGNPNDDYMGSDTTSLRSMIYTYNSDANDETALGYGLNPPAVGTMLISEPSYSGIYYKNDFSVTGNPTVDSTYYHYLNASWKDGTHLNYGGDGHALGAASCNFAFTGDAGFCVGVQSGWYGLTGGGQPLDSRILLSTQPQSLAAGETKQFTYAILMARDFVNDNLGSVCKLKTLQDSLTAWEASGYRNCPSVVTSTTAPAAALDAELFPNPTQATSTLRFENTGGHTAMLELIDVQGRRVAAPQHTSGHQFELDLTGLAQGLYLAKLSVGNSQTVMRLQKQ